MKKAIFFTLVICTTLVCSGQSGSINVTSVSQRTDGSGLVDVYYNLSGQESSYFVNMRVSFDAGVSYSAVRFNTMSGSTGPVSPGNNRHIVWNPTVDYPHRYSPQTKLKVVAYSLGISNPCPGQPYVEDIDGNLYHTIQFGDQCWMASNLNVTRNPAGVTITRRCYDGDTDNCEYYGGLYTWDTMMNGASSSSSNPSGVQGICPAGWHVPSDAEWSQLTSYLINNYVDITSGNVGNKLKSCRQVDSPIGGDCNTVDHPRWNSHGTHYGTNDFGFSAFPGGRYYSGSYNNLGSSGRWWSATQSSATNAWRRDMNSNSGSVNRSSGSTKGYGFSVRCVRD